MSIAQWKKDFEVIFENPVILSVGVVRRGETAFPNYSTQKVQKL